MKLILIAVDVAYNVTYWLQMLIRNDARIYWPVRCLFWLVFFSAMVGIWWLGYDKIW